MIIVIFITVVIRMRVAAVRVIRRSCGSTQSEKHDQSEDQSNDCSLHRVHFFWRWFRGHV